MKLRLQNGSRLALVAMGLVVISYAQEVAFVDLTKVAPRLDLRRPPSTPGDPAQYNGIGSAVPCSSSKPKTGTLEASLMSLDRVDYQLEDKPLFEVKIENVWKS